MRESSHKLTVNIAIATVPVINALWERYFSRNGSFFGGSGGFAGEGSIALGGGPAGLDGPGIVGEEEVVGSEELGLELVAVGAGIGIGIGGGCTFSPAPTIIPVVAESIFNSNVDSRAAMPRLGSGKSSIND